MRSGQGGWEGRKEGRKKEHLREGQQGQGGYKVGWLLVLGDATKPFLNIYGVKIQIILALLIPAANLRDDVVQHTAGLLNVRMHCEVQRG